MLQISLRTEDGTRRFNKPHNNSVVETRNWDNLEPSTQWATSRNHPVKELAYSPQTSVGSVETIHKNCFRKPGRHNARISTQTMRNHLGRLTLRARRPCRGHIMNRQRHAARLHWFTVQRLFFLNLPHTEFPWIKCSPYTALANVLTILYPLEHRRRTDWQIRSRDPPPKTMVHLYAW